MDICKFSLTIGAGVIASVIAATAWGQSKTPWSHPDSPDAVVVAAAPAVDPWAAYEKYNLTAATGQWQWPPSLDAVTAAPRNHKVVLENDRVRVLRVTVFANDKENLHTHAWPSVGIRPTDCSGDVIGYGGDGQILFDTRKTGALSFPVASWNPGPEAPHYMRSIGGKDCTFYRVEIKRLTTAAQAHQWPASLDGPTAAPENHRVVLENAYVRVLELMGKGHEKERVHTHPWPSVSIMMYSGEFRMYGEHGEVAFDSCSLKEPNVYPLIHWDDPTGPHAVEDLSGKPWHGFRVELKQ